MKILFITNIPSPYRIKFFNEFSKQPNCEIVVVFLDDCKKYAHRSEKWFKSSEYNFTFHDLSFSNCSTSKIHKLKLILKQNYDHVVVCGYSSIYFLFSIFYLRNKKKKFFIELDGCIEKKDVLFKKTLKKFAIKSASYYFSPNKKTDCFLYKYGANLNNVYRYPFSSLYKNEFGVRNFGLNEKQFLKNELGIKESKIVLFIGQFIYRKGVDLLIDVAKAMPHIGFYFIGLLGDCFVNDGNIHYLKFMEYLDLQKYFYCSDMMVLPSREEVWGLVVSEALSNGVPVLVSKNCGCSEELVIDGVNGFIMRDLNKQTFIDKINEISKWDFEKRGVCIDSINDYSIESMVYSHIKIFKRLLNEDA